MNLNIDSLVIEVTRKCNMQCEHCLRGPAQRKTIDDQHIYKMLQLVDCVNTLTITGGEPTLAMDSLHQIRNCAIYGNAEIYDFYMVTNGKAINVSNVAEWANGMYYACHNNESSHINFSFDNYHQYMLDNKQKCKRSNNFDNLKEIMAEEYGIYNNEGEQDFIDIHSNDSWDIESILAEGRAKDFGTRENKPTCFTLETYGEYDENFSCGETPLYLSSNGYIVADCNWSYHTIDNNKEIRIAHIDDLCGTDDFIEAIRVYNNKIEAKELQFA